MSKFSGKRLQKIKKWQQQLVDKQLLPNTQIILWRNGEWSYDESTGVRNSNGDPVGKDTIFRLYSMTKPIVSVALMQLYEEGKFLLSDPVFLYLGDAWKKSNMRVYASGDAKNYKTVPCTKNINIKHLLTHTSGLSYGFDAKGVMNKVDEIYYAEGTISLRSIKFKEEQETNLASFCDRLAKAPLMFQPGQHYNYGFNTDVCGRIVEVLSGMSLDQYLQENIFKPLDMIDTGFWVDDDKINRFVGAWMPADAAFSMSAPPSPNAKKGLLDISAIDGGANPGGQYCAHRKHPENRRLSGGGGLVGTAMDYAKFCEMLMLGGKSPNGHRIISSKTLEWMVTNHLEKNGELVHLDAMVVPGYTETNAEGVGFGLGFSVSCNPALSKQIDSKGSYRWAGAASTQFFCDPSENMFCVMMTSLRFRNDFLLPLPPLLKQVVFAAIDDDSTERKRIHNFRANL
eukprot:g4617.t1